MHRFAADEPVEMPVLDLDRGLPWPVRTELHLDLADVLGVGIELPLTVDLPGEDETPRWLPDQHPTPVTLAAVDATFVPPAAFVLDQQAPLLDRIASWLRPGGWLLATTGHDAWTGTEEHWLDGPAPMWWSQADADTYQTWITEIGLQISSEEFVPEGSSGHHLFWACRP